MVEKIRFQGCGMCVWIPAFAGMTMEDAGMTIEMVIIREGFYSYLLTSSLEDKECLMPKSASTERSSSIKGQ